jgi:hypothetical protein
MRASIGWFIVIFTVIAAVILTQQYMATYRRQIERYEDECSVMGATAIGKEQGKFFSCYRFCNDQGQFPSRFSNEALCECRIPVNCREDK